MSLGSGTFIWVLPSREKEKIEWEALKGIGGKGMSLNVWWVFVDNLKVRFDNRDLNNGHYFPPQESVLSEVIRVLFVVVLPKNSSHCCMFKCSFVRLISRLEMPGLANELRMLFGGWVGKLGRNSIDTVQTLAQTPTSPYPNTLSTPPLSVHINFAKWLKLIECVAFKNKKTRKSLFPSGS